MRLVTVGNTAMRLLVVAVALLSAPTPLMNVMPVVTVSYAVLLTSCALGIVHDIALRKTSLAWLTSTLSVLAVHASIVVEAMYLVVISHCYYIFMCFLFFFIRTSKSLQPEQSIISISHT